MTETRKINGEQYYRAAHVYPIRTITVLEEDMGGVMKQVSVLIPNHPIRPARETDMSTWWEPMNNTTDTNS